MLVAVTFVTEKTELYVHSSSLWFNKSIIEHRETLWVLWKNPAQYHDSFIVWWPCKMKTYTHIWVI